MQMIAQLLSPFHASFLQNSSLKRFICFSSKFLSEKRIKRLVVCTISFELRISRKRNSSVNNFREMMITTGLSFAFYREWYVRGFWTIVPSFFCFSTSSTFFCQNFHLTASHHGAQTWKTYVFTLSFTLCSIPSQYILHSGQREYHNQVY